MEPMKIDLLKVRDTLQAYNEQIAQPQGYHFTYYFGLNATPVAMLITVKVKDNRGTPYRGFLIKLNWRQPLEETIVGCLDRCIQYVKDDPDGLTVECSYKPRTQSCVWPR